MKIIEKNYELILATVIFGLILLMEYPFYKAIILMLEFIVVIEVVKMLSEFIEKRKLRLRHIIDVFIIFLIREVVILSAYPNKDKEAILFLLLVIFIFFIFRLFAIYFSPALYTKEDR
jgi:uncharacterized membrane protein (DUF373 family)